MFKNKRNFRMGPQEFLLIGLVVVGVWLFIMWRKNKDKEKAKEQILASAPSKTCINCNADNSADAKFCKSCGGNQFKKQEIITEKNSK